MAILSKAPEKMRDVTSFHRLLVINLQILTVLLAVRKTPKENFAFRKVN